MRLSSVDRRGSSRTRDIPPRVTQERSSCCECRKPMAVRTEVMRVAVGANPRAVLARLSEPTPARLERAASLSTCGPMARGEAID